MFQEDRLSILPDSIISHILWFLPMRYVVRTSILSKRWRNLWTTIPCLNFDDEEAMRANRFRTSISRALIRWNGVRIRKFRVNSCKFDERLFQDSELYAYFAKEKGVEEFYLHWPLVEPPDPEFDNGDDSYFVPQCLFSCSSLKLLSLRYCNFKINGSVHWNQLKSLSITKGFGFTQHVMNQILSGSPKLEILRLSVVDEGHNLNIRSDSLKELCICKHLLHPVSESLFSKLTIWTPNIETLTIKGTPYGNCRLANVKSSARVSLGFYGAVYHGTHNCDFKVDSEYSIPPQDFIAEQIYEVLGLNKHFERVTLFCCCLKVLGAVKARCTFSSFLNVKSLEIGCYYHCYGELVGFLDIFPQLKRLVLHDDRELHFNPRDDIDDPMFKCEVYFPECPLPQLRTIEVAWSSGNPIFSSIESLLKYAIKLEKMVFRVDREGGANSLLFASKKLLKMPRSSANCTIDILQEDLQSTHWQCDMDEM